MPDRDHIEIPDGTELREKLLRHQFIPPVAHVAIPAELGGPPADAPEPERYVGNRADRRRLARRRR